MANDDLTEILRRTPEMQQSPSLAMTAYQSPDDPVGTAQTLAHVGNTKNTSDAIDTVAQHHGGRSLLGTALHSIGAPISWAAHPLLEAGGEALHLAGAPLREVQHQYRYLHDVGVRHGPLNALLEGLAIGTAGAAGFVLGGFNPITGVLAGEAAGGILGRVAFRDSFDRTEKGEEYLDPTSHDKVSVGRDIGHLFGLKQGSKPFTFLSGALDGVADLSLDPLVKVGKLAAEAKTAQGLRVFSDAELAGTNVEKADLVARKLAGVKEPTGITGALGRRFGGLGFTREGDIDRAYTQYGSFRRAVKDIAGKTAGEITTDYPKLAGLEKELGEAKSIEEVKDVFKDQVLMKSMLTDTLPTRGPLNAPLSITKNRVLNWGGLGQKTRSIVDYELDASGNILRDYNGVPVTKITDVETIGRGAKAIKKLTQTARPQWFDKNFIDPETGTLSPRLRTDGFEAGSNNTFKALYDSMRMGGMSRRAAQGVVTDYAQAGPAQRIIIFRQNILKSMLQLGLPEDSEAVMSARNALVDNTGGTGAGLSDILGYGPGGKDITPLVGTGGSTVTAGLNIADTPVFPFTDWDAVTTATRDMHTWSRYMGKMDAWAYKHYTTRIFKRAALLSGGFAFRVAAGEVLPRALHDGFKTYVRDAILANSKSIGREVIEGEEPHIAAAVMKSLGGTMQGGAERIAQLSPEKIKFATLHVQNLDGQVVNPGLSVDHYVSGQINDAVNTTLDVYKGVQEAPKYKQGRARAFHADDNDQPEAWYKWMKSQANDPLHQAVAEGYGEGFNTKGSKTARMKAAEDRAVKAGKEYLDSLPEEVLRDHPRHTLSSVPGGDPHEDWARTVLENIKGSTHMDPTARFPGGVHGPHTMDWIDQIAAGTHPEMADFHDIPIENRPTKVLGHEIQPMWGNDSSRLLNFADKIHEKFLSPIINKLSREPLFLGETRRQWESLAHWREMGMTDQEAINLAQQRAGFKMSKYVHNLDERSQFAETWRNFMPFFFAQQQAWARAGRLLQEDAGAFRQYQLIAASLQNVGHVQKDADGVEHMVYPGSGFLGAAVPKILNSIGMSMAGSVPVQFSGNIHSLASVLPLGETEPSIGPLASLPLSAAKSLFPELQPGVDKLLGAGGAGNALQSFVMPNATMRGIWQSQMGEHDRSFINSEVQTVQYLAFKQQEAMRKYTEDNPEPPVDDAEAHAAWLEAAPHITPYGGSTPVEKQEFLNRVRTQTRVNFFVKSLIGAVAPMAPTIEIGDMGLNDELSQNIQKDGFAQGLQNFMDKNPDATPYEVFGSETTTNTPLSASSEAGKFMEEHMGLLKDYNYAAWLIPQSHDHFSQGVYQEQLAQGLRKKRAPDDVLNQIYVAQGNHQYFDIDKKAHDAKMSALEGNHAAQKAEKKNWSDYVQNVLGPQNPVWFHDFMNGDREVQRKEAVKQLNTIFDQGLAPQTSQTDSVKELLDDYSIHMQRMPHGTGSGDAQKVEEDNWQSYLEQVEKEKPEMKAIIQKVFRNI